MLDYIYCFNFFLKREILVFSGFDQYARACADNDRRRNGS